MGNQHRKVLPLGIMVFLWATSVFAQAPDTVWTKTYGGPEPDGGLSIAETPDQGYIITGWTRSSGGGSSDVYLVRTDAQGETI